MWNSLSLSLSGEERRRDQSIIREIILRYIMLRYNYNYKQTYKHTNEEIIVGMECVTACKIVIASCTLRREIEKVAAGYDVRQARSKYHSIYTTWWERSEEELGARNSRSLFCSIPFYPSYPESKKRYFYSFDKTTFCFLLPWVRTLSNKTSKSQKKLICPLLSLNIAKTKQKQTIRSPSHQINK